MKSSVAIETPEVDSGHSPLDPRERRPRGIITLATGADRYKQMSIDLARSLELHSPQFPRAIVTDQPDTELEQWFDFIVPADLQRESGFHHKIGMNGYTPFRETLFLDADCLATRNIDFIWGVYQHLEFGIPGALFTAEVNPTAQWYGRVAGDILNQMSLTFLPLCNTGLMWFRSGPTCDRVFCRAQELFDRYDELKVDRLNGHKNDEPLFAIAMAACGIVPIDDYGKTMSTTYQVDGRIRLNVASGRCEYQKHGRRQTPAVIHFASMTQHPVYLRERTRLRWLGRWISPIMVAFTYLCAIARIKSRGVSGRVRRLF